MTVDRRQTLLGAAGAALFSGAVAAQAQAPGAQAPAADDPRTVFQTYAAPDGRAVSVRCVAPRSGGKWGVIAFSHGANSHSTLYERLFQPWRDAGWLVLAPEHLDAGATPDRAKVSARQLTASRVMDIRTVLHQRAAADALAATFGAVIDWSQVVVAGHSYGGITAEAVAGAQTLDDGRRLNDLDPTVKAVMAFSPPGPMKDFIPPDAWSAMSLPALVETGTADVIKGFIDDWRLHRASFDNAPAGHKWLVVGDKVDHYFGGLICRLSDRDPSQSAALDATVKISLDFLNAYGRSDAAALARLSSIARTQSLAPTVTLTAG